jgi:signal transduction histidine kinase
MTEMIGKLNSILTDSFVLKMDFSIETLGKDLEGWMEYSSQELSGESLARICVQENLHELLKDRLKAGYFDHIAAILVTKSGQPLSVTISGFYLGLISEINGYIILKIKLIENSSILREELSSKKRELDSFIYRTAHDLRGPLATIKGLVNLLKLRETDCEVDELTSLIEVHANKLDDRLFRLLYLADVDDSPENFKGSLHFPALEMTLRKLLQDNCQLDKSIFRFNAPANDLPGVNEHHVSKLISNIILYIISLPVASVTKQNEIVVSIEFVAIYQWLHVRIKADGFLTSGKIQEAILQPTFLYNDLLTYPLLFNYYVAQKEAMQLNAVFRIEFDSEKEQLLELSIPLNYMLTKN